MAICKECPPVIPMSFDVEEQRDTWVAKHQGATRHEIIVVNGPFIVTDDPKVNE